MKGLYNLFRNTHDFAHVLCPCIMPMYYADRRSEAGRRANAAGRRANVPAKNPRSVSEPSHPR